MIRHSEGYVLRELNLRFGVIKFRWHSWKIIELIESFRMSERKSNGQIFINW